MKTIDELIKYCKLQNPVGALLLTGEWGCGKTYLIENELKQELKESHIIVRVSLFGIASIEEFHETIKDSWIEQTDSYPEKITKFKKVFDLFGKFNEVIPDDTAKGLVGGLLSIDPRKFLTIKNIVGDKSVVLVFDDLERSRLNTVEVLGTINEYCENQGFHIIIVADEEKIGETHKNDSGNTEKISYKEIKEKVVQRTVHHIPDYKQIVKNIIESTYDEEYKELLKTKEKELVALFSGKNTIGESLDIQAQENIVKYQFFFKDNKEEEERINEIIKHRPHNIRSLKIAIQDFIQVYNVLKDRYVRNLGDWLLSFVAFSMSARANIIAQENDMIDVDSYLYPGYFNMRFFPDSLKKWVLNGEWDEEGLCSYLSGIYFNEDSFYESMAKDHNVIQFDESVARKGIPAVLEKAYAGELTFNQYVNLIRNSRTCREYGLTLVSFDWRRIQEGIKKKEQEMISNGETEESEHEIISIENTTGYTDSEINTYNIIKAIRDSQRLDIEKIKKDYLSGIRVEPLATLKKMDKEKLLLYFDKTMAEETYAAFDDIYGPEKPVFSDYFRRMWYKYWDNSDISAENKAITKRGLSILQEKLKLLLDKYMDEPFKKKFTEDFIQGIQKQIDKANQL